GDGSLRLYLYHCPNPPYEFSTDGVDCTAWRTNRLPNSSTSCTVVCGARSSSQKPLTFPSTSASSSTTFLLSTASLSVTFPLPSASPRAQRRSRSRASSAGDSCGDAVP